MTTNTDQSSEESLLLEPRDEPLGWLIGLLKRRRGARVPVAIILALLVLAAVAALGYLCWYLWLIPLWNWGFDPPSWRGILSVLGAFYLIIIPFLPALGLQYVGSIISLYVQEEEQATQQGFQNIDVKQAALANATSQSDRAKLIPLIEYSRVHMEEYYKLSLRQAQQSYMYSLLAMWVGFAVIVGGIGLYLIPIAEVQGNLREVQILTIASGIVIELVSGLFLWMYRSSAEQLNYFYNRQIYMHTLLLCATIAWSMQDSESTKRYIVERMLDQTWGAGGMPKIELQKPIPTRAAADGFSGARDR